VDSVIRHIRNALSHPTIIRADIDNQSTGYSTIQSGSNLIENIYFVSSPDMNGKGKRKSYSAEYAGKLLKDGTFPEGVEVEKIDDGYVFKMDSNPFYRIFKITFSTEEITQLTFGLSNYLAQPLVENWDGKSFKINRFAA
jgi:hypothetical protein